MKYLLILCLTFIISCSTARLKPGTPVKVENKSVKKCTGIISKSTCQEEDSYSIDIKDCTVLLWNFVWARFKNGGFCEEAKYVSPITVKK